jgi:hypothetical protein
LALSLVVVGSGVEYGAAVASRSAYPLSRLSFVECGSNSLIPNCKVILVPFETDLKIMVLGNDFEDCIG